MTTAFVESIARFIYPTYPPYLNGTNTVDAVVPTALGELPVPGSSVPNYIQMAIPGFLISIAVEVLVGFAKQSRKRARERAATSLTGSAIDQTAASKKDGPTISANGSHTLKTSFYRFNDTINSITLGTVGQLFQVVAYRGISLVPYTYIWYHWRLMDIEDAC